MNTVSYEEKIFIEIIRTYIHKNMLTLNSMLTETQVYKIISLAHQHKLAALLWPDIQPYVSDSTAAVLELKYLENKKRTQLYWS